MATAATNTTTSTSPQWLIAQPDQIKLLLIYTIDSALTELAFGASSQYLCIVCNSCLNRQRTRNVQANSRL